MVRFSKLSPVEAFSALVILVGCALGLCTKAFAQPADFKVLVFSATAGFRHASIPDGIQTIQRLGAANNFAVDATEDATQFTEENLAQYRVVVFLSTTGDVLTNSQQQVALERFIEAGGGWVGIHAAADTHYNWPWYGGLVGAYLAGHSAIQQAMIKVADRVAVSQQGFLFDVGPWAK